MISVVTYGSIDIIWSNEGNSADSRQQMYQTSVCEQFWLQGLEMTREQEN